MTPHEYVLDSYAMMVFLKKEAGYGRVETLLKRAASGEAKLHISAVSMAELQYQVIQRGSQVGRILAALEALPLRVESADAYLHQAIELRVKHNLPLLACFDAAVAQDLRCPLVTGGRELRKLGSSISVEWLR